MTVAPRHPAAGCFPLDAGCARRPTAAELLARLVAQPVRHRGRAATLPGRRTPDAGRRTPDAGRRTPD
ncbi:hypothetical protein NGM37_16570, partial [Streptomyces sp. TRM76130]|nr:hypothetical protein [Streptomyces sp. TRM76130]